jgi:hypothetical protein
LIPVLQQATQEATRLSPEGQLLTARFDILRVQADKLLRRQGNWDEFLRFYQTTQLQAARLGPLPAAVQAPWSQIQALMADIARQRGQSIPPLGGPASQDLPFAEAVKRALTAVQDLEATLPPPPAGGDGARYQQARADLGSLRQSLQAGRAAQIVRDRRRLQLSRSALQLPQTRFWTLDQALDLVPVP